MGGGLKEPREQRGYLSYLLRLWQVDFAQEGDRSDSEVWRGSLESPLSGERQGFASLDELVEFLRRQTGAVAEVDEKPG
jgi:hypothetical protein